MEPTEDARASSLAEQQGRPRATMVKIASDLEDRLVRIGLSRDQARLFNERKTHSAHKLDELRRRLRPNRYLNEYTNLCIYASGSYARGEASEHSDLDLFFVHDNSDANPKVEEPNLKGIRVISQVIRDIEEGLEFPAPSNDGQFLNISTLSDILEHLGGSEDDYRNHFTARMLLLLESTPVYGSEDHKAIIKRVLESYMRDYQDHADDFRPTFLVNDVLRFWRTLCLNYEHRRNQDDEARKLKQKIKNFKLGFSRLSTCFATVALLASYNHVDLDDLLSVTELTPVERLLRLSDRHSEVVPSLKKALELYAWFLERTALSSAELQGYFSEKRNREEAFGKARAFGECMFDLLYATATSKRTLRYLVI